MIEIRSLTKRFGDTTAVDDVSFDVLPGRVTGFLGPNGSGKSTTMRMIMGLDGPTSGTVTVNGRPYRAPQAAVRGGRPARRQGDARRPHGPQPPAVPGPEQRHRAQPGGRGDRAGRPRGRWPAGAAGGFSLGMSQRLGIAAALLGDPAVLIFDEPVNGLDPEGIQLGPHPAAVACRRGPHRARLQPPDERDGADRRPPARDRRGRLIADTCVEEFIEPAPQQLRTRPLPPGRQSSPARSPRGRRQGRDPRPDGALAVSGWTAPRSATLAAAAGIALSELIPQLASLEEAFMEFTRDSVEFHAGADPIPMPAAVGPEA